MRFLVACFVFLIVLFSYPYISWTAEAVIGDDTIYMPETIIQDVGEKDVNSWRFSAGYSVNFFNYVHDSLTVGPGSFNKHSANGVMHGVKLLLGKRSHSIIVGVSKGSWEAESDEYFNADIQKWSIKPWKGEGDRFDFDLAYGSFSSIFKGKLVGGLTAGLKYSESQKEFSFKDSGDYWSFDGVLLNKVSKKTTWLGPVVGAYYLLNFGNSPFGLYGSLNLAYLNGNINYDEKEISEEPNEWVPGMNGTIAFQAFFLDALALQIGYRGQVMALSHKPDSEESRFQQISDGYFGYFITAFWAF